VDDEAMLAEIRERVSLGGPIDQVFGRPGKNLAGASMVGVRGRKRRRMYTWGTPECEDARQRGLLERPRMPRPVRPAQLQLVAEVINAPLPQILARILTEIANGGVGPGLGLLGVGPRSHKTDLDDDGLVIARQVANGEWGPSPAAAFPLCHWGCGVMSFVTSDGQVWGWDPNPIDPDDDVPFLAESMTLTAWLELWLAGTLQQPWAVMEGKTWRAATQGESREALDGNGS
jgi:hypothetical protein